MSRSHKRSLKRPKQPSQPIAIFKHAERFLDTVYLLEATPHDEKAIIAPMLVLTAFASELYLKTLIALEGKRIPPTHDLFELFRKLSPAQKASLEDKWNAVVVQREHALQGIEAVMRSQGMHSGIPRDLTGRIKGGRYGFEFLRYLYEETGPFVFGLHDLPICLRRTILELHPEWAPPDMITINKGYVVGYDVQSPS